MTLKYDLFGLYDDNMDIEEDNDSPFRLSDSVCEYYEPEQLSGHVGKQDYYTSYFHINCRGLSCNWEYFRDLLCILHGDDFAFDFIGISEEYNGNRDSRLSLDGV